MISFESNPLQHCTSETSLCCSVQAGGRCGSRRRAASNSTRCCSPLKTLSLFATSVPTPTLGALLVADYANRCVKAVAASGRAALVFQCGADSRPRALQLVRPGGRRRRHSAARRVARTRAAGRPLRARRRRAQRPALRRDAPTAASGARERGPYGRCQYGHNERRVRSDWEQRSQSARSDRRARLEWHRATGGAAPTGLRAVDVLSGRSGRERAAGRNGRLDSHSARAAGGGVERRAGTASARAPHRWRREPSARSSAAVRAPRAGRRVARVAREPRGRVSLRFRRAAAAAANVLRVERQVRINCWRAAGERVLLFDSNHNAAAVTRVRISHEIISKAHS